MLTVFILSHIRCLFWIARVFVTNPVDLAESDGIDESRIGTDETLRSNVKAITVAGVLDSGLATVNSVYDATSPIYFGRFSINDFHGKRRPLTVTEAFIYSSNIASAKMAMHMGVPAHRAFLKKLGLLDPVVTELGPSASPIVPSR